MLPRPFVVASLLLAASNAHAAAAPLLDWRTIESACCDVHFPAPLEPIARRVATIADDSAKKAGAFLRSAPLDRVQIVLHDVTDTPNGFASVVPYDVIDLRTVTPEGDSDLAVTDEYLRLLVQHEMLHVVHLDTIHGVPALVNLVFGKVWPPNLIQPRFVVEGLATYVETRETTGGRLRSTAFRADVLIGALAGDVWQLDDLSSYSRRNPSGGAAYAYGAAFVQWLSDRYGPRIWSAIAHDYGSGVIPYAVQRAIESATGNDVEADYQLFVDDVRRAADALRARVDARGGPTKARRLTRVGGTLRTPRFASDGSLYVGVDPPNGPAGLYAIRGLPAAVPTLVPVVRTGEVPDVALAGDELVLTQTETTRGYYSFHDLWRSRSAGDGATLERITREARVRAPASVPKTKTLIAEQRTASSAALVKIDLDSGDLHDVVRAGESAGTIWYTPDVSPDGSAVVASRWQPGGRRDLVEIDLATGSERELTNDAAQDLDPAYTLDGAHVLFASDREGPFAIYALSTDDLTIRRVVDTLGLARAPRPTPDGRAVVYIDTHVEGQDLYAASLDLAHAPLVDAPQAPAPPLQPLTAPSVAPTAPYDALWTLRPRTWVPLVVADPTGALALGVALVGEDAAALHSWAAQATWGFGLARPAVAASWRFQDWPLPVLLGAEWRTDASDAIRRTDGLPDVQQETVLRGSALVQMPLLRSRRHAHTLSLGYVRELHIVENPLTSPPDARAPIYPPSATIGAVTFDWSFAGTESYRDSVSTERGLSSFLRVRHANRLLWSEQDITEVSVDVRAFHPVGIPAHVVALYLSGGVGFGEPLRRARFSLGGFEGRDLTRDLLDGNRSGSGVLRGYARGALSGDAFTLATVEYRFPLVEIERGISTLPVFVDRLHGAVFTDAGLAFSGGPPDPRAMRVSIGAELRLQLTLGYYGQVVVRAGYARGVSPGGTDQPYVVVGFPY